MSLFGELFAGRKEQPSSLFDDNSKFKSASNRLFAGVLAPPDSNAGSASAEAPPKGGKSSKRQRTAEGNADAPKEKVHKEAAPSKKPKLAGDDAKGGTIATAAPAATAGKRSGAADTQPPAANAAQKKGKSAAPPEAAAGKKPAAPATSGRPAAKAGGLSEGALEEQQRKLNAAVKAAKSIAQQKDAAAPSAASAASSSKKQKKDKASKRRRQSDGGDNGDSDAPSASAAPAAGKKGCKGAAAPAATAVAAVAEPAAEPAKKKSKKAADAADAAEAEGDGGAKKKDKADKKKEKKQKKEKQSKSKAAGSDSDGSSDEEQAGAAPASGAGDESASDSGAEDGAAGPAADGTADGGKAKVKLSPEEEAEKLQRTLFVGNLPATISRKAVKRLFAEYGAVESVRLRSVTIKQGTKMPRKAAVLSGAVDAEKGAAHAYVVMRDAAGLSAALAANMSQVEGRHIRVDRAAAPASKTGTTGSQYDPLRSIFVGNLAWDVKDEDLIAAFNACGRSGKAKGASAEDASGQGAVEAVRVVRDGATNIGKGFAFVLFRTKAAARAALDMDGHKLGKRPMRITRVSTRAVSATRIVRKPGEDAVSAVKGGKGSAGGGASAGGRGGKTLAPVKSADWQGLQTKGRGAGLRGPAAAPRGGKAGAAGGKPENRARADKRPSVLLRKAQQRAAAGGPPVLKSLKRKVERAIDQGSGKAIAALKAKQAKKPKRRPGYKGNRDNDD